MRPLSAGFALAAALAACASAPPPAPVAPQPAPAAAPQPAPAPAAPSADAPPPCDVDPAATSNAKRGYECAREAFDHAEYDVADHLAELVATRFLYSRFATLSVLLRADILAARHQDAEAVAAYDQWLHDHPAHELRDDVRRRRDAIAAPTATP
jgi:hypothetical protein